MILKEMFRMSTIRKTLQVGIMVSVSIRCFLSEHCAVYSGHEAIITEAMMVDERMQVVVIKDLTMSAHTNVYLPK